MSDEGPATFQPLLTAVGTVCIVLALCRQVVTVAGGHYGPILTVSLLLTAAADGCFVAAFLLGGTGWRVAAVAGLLPSLFVFADTARRLFGLWVF